MPKISVLMPVYKTNEKYLREAIESILTQTYTDFEFIIINDGSTNNVADVIGSYNDSRIVYVENEQNLKLIKTLNKGLEIAKGEYVIRMDSDDVSRNNRLEKSVEFMDNNPNIAAAGTHALGHPIKLRYKAPSADYIIKPFCRYVANCMVHPTMIIRLSALKENGLKYDERYLHNEDYKLWLELNKHSQLANIPEELLLHRTHDKAVSVEFAKKQQDITCNILWENLLEDFAPRNRRLKKITKKLEEGLQISTWELISAEKFLTKIVVRLNKNFTPDIHPYVKNTYRGLYKRLLLAVKPSFLTIVAVHFSVLCDILELNKFDMVNIVISQLEKEASGGKFNGN